MRGRGRENGRRACDVHARGGIDKRICSVTATLQDSIQLAQGQCRVLWIGWTRVS